jgi:hypothetical protein
LWFEVFEILTYIQESNYQLRVQSWEPHRLSYVFKTKPHSWPK